MNYYELSRLMATAESLHAQYEQAKSEKKNEEIAREVLNELECALVQIDRQTASTTSVGSDPKVEGADISAHVRAPSSPLRAVTYMWVSGFWIWVLVTCLEDQYPAVKTLINALH